MFFVLASMANGQTLSKMWQTDSVLLKPESAIYDSVTNAIYASNINGKYCAKDGNGFIAKISLNGKIVELEMIKGLDSPQGLGLHRHTLYVADVNKVVVMDILKKTIEKTFVIDTAIFLNDVATDSNGDVYISDCKANKIYQLSDNKMSIWLDSVALKGPNGLLCTRQDVMILNMGTGVVYRVDKKTKTLHEFSSGIKNCDGITSDGVGGYFVSGAWQGEIYHLNARGEKTLVLNLGPEKTIAADITYIPNRKMLLIPTLRKTLLAYRWE